jgi:hypothetical protein
MVASRSSKDSRLGIWAIDSGASHNYCNDLTEFKKDSITEANMIIKLWDKNEVHARTKGMLQLNGNGTYAIIDHLSNNPLSAALDRGLYILPRHGSAHPSSATILPRHGSAHPSSATILPRFGSAHTPSTTNIRKSDSIEVWHRRLAHLNYADLKLILDSDKKTEGWTPWEIPGLCETCVKTKQQQHMI